MINDFSVETHVGIDCVGTQYKLPRLNVIGDVDNVDHLSENRWMVVDVIYKENDVDFSSAGISQAGVGGYDHQFIFGTLLAV
jgi:hypothetical protein